MEYIIYDRELLSYNNDIHVKKIRNYITSVLPKRVIQVPLKKIKTVRFNNVIDTRYYNISLYEKMYKKSVRITLDTII